VRLSLKLNFSKSYDSRQHWWVGVFHEDREWVRGEVDEIVSGELLE